MASHAIIERLQRGLWMALSQCRFEAAAGMARDLLSIDPDNASGLCGLCSALSDLFRLDEAVAAGLRAVEVAPEWSSAHFTLGRALHYGESEYALRFVEEAIRLEPEEALYWWAVSAWHVHFGDGERALAAAESGLALDPQEPDCLKQRALAYAVLGREQEALAAMEEAFIAKPDWRFHEAAAGWVHMTLKRYGSAEEHLRRALAINPLCPWSHEGLGMTQLATGNTDGGIQHLQEVLRICPFGNARPRAELHKLGQTVPPEKPLYSDTSRLRSAGFGR